MKLIRIVSDILKTFIEVEQFVICMVSLDLLIVFSIRGHRGRDRMVVRFTTTCAISVYHH